MDNLLSAWLNPLNTSGENFRDTLPAYKQLKKLRTALAVAQGASLLLTLQQDALGTVSHDQTKRVSYLTALFSRIHREIYCDWKEQITVPHRPGSITNAARRREFREVIGRLVMDGDENHDTAIFDHNGFAFQSSNIAERLADFYDKMRRVRPFAYGNRLTLDFFVTMLGKLPAIKSVYEQGIDFRRLDAADADALHNTTSQHSQIVAAFQHAMDPNRCISLPNIPNGYGRWPENKRFVSGIPFLAHTTPEGVECLVLVNGGLVPFYTIQQDLFITGKHLADYPFCPAETIIGYLPDTEDLRYGDEYEIDGIHIGKDGGAPLFCLDVNLLTGLRSPSHTELLELLKVVEGDKATILQFANNPALKHKLQVAAGNDDRLLRTVEIAYERLGKINAKLENLRTALFEGKTPDPQPKLFMSMGGAGAGKTVVEDIAQTQCGDNFVIASLDEFRKKSDLYRVLIAANHHSDDYVFVEPFANRLRDAVAEYAQINRINILYDGTGIPYQPRYATIIGQFKACGFYTQITAVDAFLIKPVGREEELKRSTVIFSVKDRFEKTGRALPWVVTIDKHIRAPRSFLQALQDAALDKISLFANDGERNSHYLVAESFDFTEQEVRTLQHHQKTNNLYVYLITLSQTRLDAFLHNLAQGDVEQINSLLERNHGFNEGNVGYQIYPNNTGNRVLVIYNLRRMVDFVQKRQLNPNASNEEGLLHKPETLAFHIDPFAQTPSLTQLQDTLSYPQVD